jgi:hypothetical protein
VGAPRASFAATSRLTVSCGSHGKAVPIDTNTGTKNANTGTKNANKRMNNANKRMNDAKKRMNDANKRMNDANKGARHRKQAH